MAVIDTNNRPPLQSAVNAQQPEKQQYVYNKFADVVAAGNGGNDVGWDKNGQPVKGANAQGNGGANVGNGGTSSVAGVQPRANAFQSVGGKGKTIDQRKSIQEQNNASSNGCFLQAAASDSLARHDNAAKEAQYSAEKSAYQNGQLPVMPKAPDTSVDGSNMEQFRSQQRQNDTVAWGGNSSNPNDPAYQKPDGRSEFQKFRDSLYDEESIRKKSDTQAKVLAIGDALRNIGNLYYVGAKGASPQKYGTDFASAERDRYETGKQNRDAVAYKMYQADLAQKAQDAEQKRKDLLAQGTLAKDMSTVDYNKAKTDKTLQDMGIDAAMAPVKLKKMVAEYDKLLADGKKAEADALYSQIRAEWLPKSEQDKHNLSMARQNQANAAAASSRSRAASYASSVRMGNELKKAQISKLKRGDDFDLPSKDPNKNWSINKNNAKNVENVLKQFARKKGWADEDATEQQLIDAAMDHLDDDDLNKEISKYARGKEVDNNTYSSWK